MRHKLIRGPHTMDIKDTVNMKGGQGYLPCVVESNILKNTLAKLNLRRLTWALQNIKEIMYLETQNEQTIYEEQRSPHRNQVPNLGAHNLITTLDKVMMTKTRGRLSDGFLRIKMRKSKTSKKRHPPSVKVGVFLVHELVLQKVSNVFSRILMHSLKLGSNQRRLNGCPLEQKISNYKTEIHRLQSSQQHFDSSSSSSVYIPKYYQQRVTRTSQFYLHPPSDEHCLGDVSNRGYITQRGILQKRGLVSDMRELGQMRDSLVRVENYVTQRRHNRRQ